MMSTYGIEMSIGIRIRHGDIGQADRAAVLFPAVPTLVMALGEWIARTRSNIQIPLAESTEF